MPILGIMLAILALAKLAVQLWGLNKGYDVTDEGLYILMMNFSDQYPTEPHNYYTYILNALVPIKNWDLLTLRRISLISEITGIAYFTLSVGYWLKLQVSSPFKLSFSPLALILFSFLAAAFLSVYPRAYSYNDLSYFTTLFTAGTTLWMFAGTNLMQQLKRPLNLFLLFIIGILLGAQLIAKFSTSVLLLIWVPTFLLVRFKKPLAGALASFGIVLLGELVFLGFFFKGFEGFSTWLTNLKRGVELLQLLSYETYGIFIQGYLQVDIIENAQYYLLPLGMAIAVRWVLKKWTNISNDLNLFLAFTAGLLMWYAWSTLVQQYFLGAFYYRFIAVHIYTLLFLGFPLLQDLLKQKRFNWIWMILMLAALPFISLVGSNNPMTQTLTRYLAPWAVLIALFLSTRVTSIKAMQGFVLLIVTVSLINYVTVQVYNPYALPAPLTAQQYTVDDMHFAQGIKVDKPTADMFSQLSDIANRNGYKPGGPILAFGDLCGVATALGGYIPETFWYFSDQSATSPTHARNYSCLHLNNLRMAEHKNNPLLIISESTHQQVIDCLATSEVPYPELYFEAGAVYSPYRDEMLYVLVPKQWDTDL